MSTGKAFEQSPGATQVGRHMGRTQIAPILPKMWSCTACIYKVASAHQESPPIIKIPAQLSPWIFVAIGEDNSPTRICNVHRGDKCLKWVQWRAWEVKTMLGSLFPAKENRNKPIGYTGENLNSKHVNSTTAPFLKITWFYLEESEVAKKIHVRVVVFEY